MREKILTLEYVLFLSVSSPHPFVLYWYIYTPMQCQVGSFAVFILRHRCLIGGGRFTAHSACDYSKYGISITFLMFEALFVDFIVGQLNHTIMLSCQIRAFLSYRIFFSSSLRTSLHLFASLTTPLPQNDFSLCSQITRRPPSVSANYLLAILNPRRPSETNFRPPANDDYPWNLLGFFHLHSRSTGSFPFALNPI
ncbi:hypothetical protein RHMOL_Rhmol05G0155800 [Rhododendron molle]|uniref:Uncharacterized protein n=1 Tax=Rhododendron molle TaxID=49168 RepID=A0ACC0NQD9_RHOML|nr:hypothetical protein RHMOL_Rhmol05G0155800 [Rhododendron molle]